MRAMLTTPRFPGVHDCSPSRGFFHGPAHGFGNIFQAEKNNKGRCAFFDQRRRRGRVCAAGSKFREVAIAFILKAIEGSDYEGKVDLMLDLVASQFYKREPGASEGYYGLKSEVMSRG